MKIKSLRARKMKKEAKVMSVIPCNILVSDGISGGGFNFTLELEVNGNKFPLTPRDPLLLGVYDIVRYNLKK